MKKHGLQQHGYNVRVCSPHHLSWLLPVCRIVLTMSRLRQCASSSSYIMQELATWAFGDWVFGQETDWFSNVSKIRRAGFHGQNLDTYEMFVRQFDRLRKDKTIPP